MSDQTNSAERYARTIGQELLALETILDGAPKGYYPDHPEYDDEEHTDYRAAVNELEMEHVTDPDEIPFIWINETCLDITYLTTHDLDRARIEILRTCGGPHCEITRDTNDGTAVTVTVHDGSDSYHHRMYLDNVSTWLDDLAGLHQ